MHSTACKKNPSTFDESVIVDIPQAEASPLQIQKTYLHAKTLLSYHLADKNDKLAARTKTHARRLFRAVEKRFSLGEELAPPTPAARKQSPGFDSEVLPPALEPCQYRA